MTSHHQLVDTQDKDNTIVEQFNIRDITATTSQFPNQIENNGDRQNTRDNFNNNLNDSLYEDKQSVNSIMLNRIPKKLKKTFYISLSLFLLGILMIILGTEEVIRTSELNSGMTYLIIGGIVSIPGCFYVYQFYKAKRCENLEEKTEIYDEIPEL